MSVRSDQFYVRQASVPSIGLDGLSRLRSSIVAIAGAGGVGSSAAYYLARSGVGKIILIDQDIVEPSNLQRLQSATKSDLFQPKAEVLSRRLADFDSSTRFEAVVDTITDHNVDHLLDDSDIVLDGLDNFRTRYILNQFSVRTKSPYLFVSAVAEQAHFALFNPPSTPCLQCIMPDVRDRFDDSCETLGVSPTTTGIAGTIAASTVIRFLLGRKTRLTKELLTIDMSALEFLYSGLSMRVDCSQCGNVQSQAKTIQPRITRLCGEHTANVLPSRVMDIKLEEISANIPDKEVLADSESVLVFRQGRHTISLFRNGRILISGIDDEAEATRVAHAIWENLGELRNR